MGNFEKLSVLVIVVIIVMILVVALYTLTDDGDPQATVAAATTAESNNIASFFETKVDSKVTPVTPALTAEKPLDMSAPPVSAGGASTGTSLDPVATPATPVVATVEVREHVIASGDTLERISKKYYGSTIHIAAIEKANPGLDPMRLRVGKKIVIPDVKSADGKSLALATDGLEKIAASTPRRSVTPGDSYTVRRGDSLPEIARRAYGKIDRWHEIWIENFDRIENPDRLAAGTRLNIPN
jgi:nucleoid-associated protein YgaU